MQGKKIVTVMTAFNCHLTGYQIGSLELASNQMTRAEYQLRQAFQPGLSGVHLAFEDIKRHSIEKHNDNKKPISQRAHGWYRQLYKSKY